MNTGMFPLLRNIISDTNSLYNTMVHKTLNIKDKMHIYIYIYIYNWITYHTIFTKLLVQVTIFFIESSPFPRTPTICKKYYWHND